MTTENSRDRLAGLLYLVVVVAGTFSLGYVPSQVTVPEDPAATVANIVAAETLFRWGLAGFVVMQVAFLLLPLALYRLFRNVDRPAAVLMVALALASVPIGLVGLTHKIDALELLTDPAFGAAYASPQLQAEAMAALLSYGNTVLMASVFWGLWLIPFGYLVVKSGAVPRVLGVLLMLGGVGYTVDLFGDLLVPGYSGTLLARYATLPASAGEILTCLWLLLVGARRPAADT